MPDDNPIRPQPDTYEHRNNSGAPDPTYHLPVPPPPKPDK